ncbi:hypothetical protein [Chryseobacterium shandongense]|uniref:hypothetical protein n=1 Tax=Chryseobacterium shandongense TaxID=1493872 RepID=UPI000F4E3F9C|nr:hypothetical protein [Chryseobacterium shandongense]AZA59046.1 hypothetical protein EG350_18460 [Chryseobacterium shandongense]
MKKIFLSFFAVTLTLIFSNSCREHENLTYDGESFLHFDKKDQTVANGNVNITYGVTKAVSGDHNVEIIFNSAKSTAILGTDFTIVESKDVLKDGSVLGDFVINVTPAAAAAKKEAVFTLQSSTLQNAVFNQEVLVKFACESLLAGTYQFSTSNFYTPDTGVVVLGPVTGTVTFATTAVSGEYTISDASFGAYKAMYGGSTVASNVRLRDLCNTLSFFGNNQYGDSHSISNIVVNGNQLTFKWSTSYGEYGTTTLTKSNGNWPALN